MANCSDGSFIPDDVVRRLHATQAGLRRHKCPACAYQLGLVYAGGHAELERCDVNNLAPCVVLDSLPEDQGRPARHLCAVCAFAEGLAAGSANASLEIDGEFQVAQAAGAQASTPEGVASLQRHLVYERDRKNRTHALLYHGHRCLACGFYFDDVYTHEHAAGYIEVHHIRPLADGPRIVDPKVDLIPLCANCHRMSHRRKGMSLNLDELRRLIASARK